MGNDEKDSTKAKPMQRGKSTDILANSASGDYSVMAGLALAGS